MYVKLQHLDTNCIPILHSVKTSKTNINGGVSLPLPRHRTEREFEQLIKKHKIPPQKPSDFDKKSVFHKPKSDPDSLIENPERKKGITEKHIGVKGRVWSRKDTLEKKKLHPEYSTKVVNGYEVVKKVHTKYSTKVVSGNEVVKKVHTNCSTKWARYGGCIPAILDTLERVSDLDEAFKPWELSLNNKERTIILKEQKSWQRAMEIFNWFKTKGCYELNVIHYNIIIRILGKAQRWKELEIFMNEMEENRIESINSTYGTLIDVYGKGGIREKAMYYLDIMNQKEMEPDEVTMGIVLQMYKTSGQFEKAEEFFKKWSARKTTPVSNPQVHVCLSAYTFNTLIDTYGKSGRLKDASETFDKMIKEGIIPTTVTLNSMIHMFGNHGQLDEVASLMQRMEQFQCVPDTRTYNILISTHIKQDNIVLATGYFKKMKKAALLPDVVSYRTLLYAFSIRQMVSEAEELITEMDKRGLEIDEFTQSSITRMYIDSGMLNKSWLWFERFHILGEMSPECYSASIDAFGSRGHVLEAEQVFKCCQERRNPSVLEFNVMIKAYGVKKRYKDVCRLIDSMEENGVFPDKCSYNSVVQMLAGGDRPETAAFYLRKMRDAGLVTDCIPYCAVISGFVKSGELETAIELFQEMIRSGFEPDVVVYGVLINAYADIGNVEKALLYVNMMEKTGLQMNPVICNTLIKLYTKVGCLRKAEEAYYTLLLLSSTNSHAYSSNCMIDLYTKQSMMKPAEEIFEKLRRSGTANEFSYAMMLCMYKKIGSFEEAFRVAKEMRELGFMNDLLSYNHVLGLYASDGRFKEAVTIFKEMTESGVEPDDSTFRFLGVVLMKRGVPKNAVTKLEGLRKKDYESGLEAWRAILDSVVSMVYRDISD